jgi:COMPASS component SWD3
MLSILTKVKLNTTVTSIDLYNNLLLVTGTDKKIKIFDLESEKWVQEIEGHTLGVNQGMWDMFGDYIFSCSDDGTVKIWSKTGKLVTTLIGHTNYVQTMALDKKNLMLLSGGNDCSVFLWDIRSAQEISSFYHIHQEPVTCLDFSADSSLFLTGSYDGTVHLWDTMSLNSLKTCSFSRNVPISHGKFIGSYIYCSCLDSKILLWNIKEVKSLPIKQYYGHTNEYYCCDSIARKPGELFSGSEDGKLLLWNLHTGDKKQEYQIYPNTSNAHLGVLNTFDIANNLLITSSFNPNDWTDYDNLIISKLS